jgi:phosphate ABC transporter membrane protein
MRAEPIQPFTRRLPYGEDFKRNIARRRFIGHIWRYMFFSSLIIGMIALVTLLGTIVNRAFGTIAVQERVNPATLSEQPLEELSQEELLAIAQANLSGNVRRRLDREEPLEQRSAAELLQVIEEFVLQREVVKSWTLSETLFNYSHIEAEAAEQFPNARLEFKSWVSWDFVVRPMSRTPALAGIRTALLGSTWMILITMLIAFPIGVGAAIYLEEYARDNLVNRIIQTNINNLAGVPSIIYGMLGLAIFVRNLEYLTSGRFMGEGMGAANGRTLISAAMTMALLILPLIIINAQEAIRAVPNSLRQASYGLGATKWQTIWNHVLPVALPGILTGTILGMSRAVGETAPLIVIGAATYIVTDPSGPFSSFTALPIQIYNWTSRPQDQFRDIAGAGIVVLLILLLSLNAAAILLRNRFQRSL